MSRKLDRDEIERIKESVLLSGIMDLEWDRRLSDPRRSDWWACCPFHFENTPSFHVDDRRGRYKCFGCSASGDAIDWLVEYHGMNFLEAVEKISGKEVLRKPKIWKKEAKKEGKIVVIDRVLKIWNECQPLGGTYAESYLQGRGLERPFPVDVLRHHPGLEWALGAVWDESRRKIASGPMFPALVAKVQQPDGEMSGIWRIYVTRFGDKAQVRKPKLGLGTIAGGAVRIGGVSRTIGLCEGIETALAVWQMNDREFPVWSGLSASGISSFNPPDGVEEILVFPDGDLPKFDGQRWGEATGLSAAKALKKRLGPMVNIQPSPDDGDFLDILNRVKEAV